MVNVHTLSLGAYQTNCYFAWGEGSQSCIVIDPGFTPEVVLQKANELGKRIDAILLTHGHFDHVGGVKAIAKLTGCAVYLHEGELSMPESWTDGPLFYTDTYGEGDVLELCGLSIRVLHTPGHTPGSVCLAAEDTLFTGDTLFWNSCGRTDLPCGDPIAISKSLKRLAGLQVDYRVLSGHGQATSLFAEQKHNPFMNR